MPPRPSKAAINPFDTIFSWLWDFHDWLILWADSIWFWIPGRDWFVEFIKGIAQKVWDTLTPVAEAAAWYLDVTQDMADILDWQDIIDWVKDWVSRLEEIWNWFRSWPSRVWGTITDWWNDPDNPIKAAIATATEGLPGLLTAWSNFWTELFPNLVNMTWLSGWWSGRLQDVQDLIAGMVLELAPLWEGWQDLRAEVAEFFSDPYQWVYDRLDKFFERFW